VTAAGAVIGVLFGLFGVGGSSFATPALGMLGVPGLIAVAAPLPATIPAAIAGAAAYVRRKQLDALLDRGARESAVKLTLAQGIPKGSKMDLIVEKATELGAALRGWWWRASGPASCCRSPRRAAWPDGLGGAPVSSFRPRPRSGSSLGCWPTAAGSCSSRCSSWCSA